MVKKFYVDSQDEDNIPELIEETKTYAEPIVVEEKAVSAADERRVAKQLEGHPQPFDAASVRVLEVLQQRGIAALFDEGWARGWKWAEYNRQG